MTALAKSPTPVKLLVIEASGMIAIDYTGSQVRKRGLIPGTRQTKAGESPPQEGLSESPNRRGGRSGSSRRDGKSALCRQECQRARHEARKPSALPPRGQARS